MNIIKTGYLEFVLSYLVEKLYKKNSFVFIDNLSTGILKYIKNFLKKINNVKLDISKLKEIEKYLNLKPKSDIENRIKLLLRNLDYCLEVSVWTHSKIKIVTR